MQKLGRLISLLILPLIGIIIYSTLKAYITGKTPIWTFEVSLFLFGSFFMLGAAYCHMENKHVAVDVLKHYAPPWFQRIQGVFSELVVLFVVLVILWVSVPAALRATVVKERSMHQTPFNPQVWWFRWIIPLSCALMSWQSLRNMLGFIFPRFAPPGDSSSEQEV